jgi:prepilin-type N-terminal cleavage/methylation domain-containing protein
VQQKGFTLIELVVAVGIIAVLIGALVPSAQGLRTGRNAYDATVTLRQIRDAQAAFHAVDRDGDGALEYAASLQELVAAGVLGADIADGIRQGYAFQTGTPAGSQSQVGYAYLATPMNQGQTGVRGFAGNASGIDPTECPPGEHVEIVGGELACVGNQDPLAGGVRLPIGEAGGVAAVNEANRLVGGVAVGLARPLLTDAFVAEVKAEFDANRDRKITFAELLSADLMAMARRVASRHPGGPAVGDDAALEVILRSLQDRLRDDLALGAGDEMAAPPLPIDAAVGFPRIVLEQAAVARRE